MHHDTSYVTPNDTTTQMLNNMAASNNKKFNKVIPKCYNKNACRCKITVRAGDRKQEVYNWWPYLYRMWRLKHLIIVS